MESFLKKLEVKKMKKQLFNENGRMLLSPNFKGTVCNPEKENVIKQPTIDYANVLDRLRYSFPFVETERFVSVSRFRKKAEMLIKKIKMDSSLSNLLRGAYFPICLPRVPHIGQRNYGWFVDGFFIPSVQEISHVEGILFENYFSFMSNNCNGIILEESRHANLLLRMKREPVVGIVFFPFQGYSALAQFEHMALLPTSLLLCGVVDVATTIVAYPELVDSVAYRGLNCSAINYWNNHLPFMFNMQNLNGRRVNFCMETRSTKEAVKRSSGGVIFVGEK